MSTAAAAPTPQSAIQADWENREFIETISAGVKKIADFLNQFDMSARYKLAILNEKLTSLERSLKFVEAKFTATGVADEASAP